MVWPLTRWLLDSALAAGVILLLGTVLMALVRQPARRQRVGEWTLVACLAAAVLQAVALPRVELGLVTENAGIRPTVMGIEAFPEGGAGTPAAGGGVTTTVGASAVVSRGAWAEALTWVGQNWAIVLAGGYGLGVLVAAGRMVLGHAVLRRMGRQGRAARGALAALWAELTATLPRPAVLKVSDRVGRPLCFGLRRPVVLVPGHLVRRAEEAGDWGDLRIILLHELVHVRRRDARTWVLASAAKVLFFYQPLLWRLQKELRLAQEYIADAWAAEHASSPVAYAENLLRLVKLDARPIPAPATAAVRGPSEFYRRMQRLLTQTGPTEKACTGRWTLAAAAVTLTAAAICSAITVQTGPTARLTLPGPEGAASSVSLAERRGVAYLLSRQSAAGGWLAEFGPAPTALVVRALLQHGVSPDAPEVRRALAFLETFRQSDHGFYADTEPTYNTAIVLTTLSMIPGERYAADVVAGRAFLESRRRAEAARGVGGWYGAGVAGRDRPRWMDPTERTAEAVLESYGAMTYANLKSFAYAGLTRDDARVKRSVAWVKGNWTLERNPGLNSHEGLYYYYHLLARTLRAHGEETLTDARGRAHAWRVELAEVLSRQQRGDGSWVNGKSGRWLEDRPELVTAYAVLALQETR